MENITVTARRTDPNVANSIDFLTGMPIGFFDNQQGLPSSLTQGEGYQTGISDDIQRQINEGLALQQAQHEEKMAEELAEELAENLESEIADSAESALGDASQNMSLIDRIVQGAMARFGPTAGIRALNELFSILPGTGRITGGIEGLLDAGDDWLGDLASRNPFGRAIDRLAPAERAGRGAIDSAESRFSRFVDPIKMGMEWMKIMQNPLAEVAGMAFEGRPNAQRLVRSALTPPPPGMAQGGAVNYNNPLMMRRGGSTRRRRRSRRGGVDSLMARRRRLSPAEARRQERREEVMEREAGPIVGKPRLDIDQAAEISKALGVPVDITRSTPGAIAAQYRSDQRARERQRQRQAPLEQRRLPDNRAAMEQRMVDEQAVRDSMQPIWYSPEDRARDAAISRYKKSLNMQEDLAGGPLAGLPTPVTGGDQIRFGPGGQPMPQREPLQGPGGGGSRLGTGYEPQRGQPGYRPPSPQSQVRDQRARYMPERRRPQQMPGQQPPITDSIQQMLDYMGAHKSDLEQAQQQQQQPQLPDSVLQMLEEMGNQQDRLDSFRQPDPLQQLMDDLEMRRRRAQYGASMPRRAAGGGMINADPFAGYRARRR